MNIENERLTVKMLPFIDFTKYCSPRVDIDSKIFVKFLNLTRSNIMVFWHSFSGDVKKYSTIPPGHSLDMNTFIGHIWSFVDELTGDHLMDDRNNYYVAVERRNNAPLEHSRNSADDANNYEVIKIKTPLMNLKDLCYKAIRNELVFNNNLSVYEQLNNLPRGVLDELKVILLKGMTYAHRPDV
ncbi:hypothetical protein WDU94_005983 [Cyamophila willieti]